MIESLRIENLGTISHAELVFSPGFTVITGETGAGKTMLLNSLNWLLGEKPRASLVSAGTTQAVVEGTFLVDVTAGAVVEEAGGVVEDGAVEAARVVPAKSRSRAHLGGRTVPAATLSEFGADLVSVHGQASQGRLRSEKAQREALDAFGGKSHQSALGTYRECWQEWTETKRSYEEWEASRDKREQRREELANLSQIFETLQPEDGEFSELTAKVARLSNVESLRENAAFALGALDSETEGQPGANELVAAASRALEKASREDASLEDIATTVSGSGYALADAARELGVYLQDLNADPEALQAALTRRAAFTDLSLKVAEEPDQLGTVWQDVDRELAGLQGGEDRLEELKAKLEADAQMLSSAGKTLHQERLETAETLSEAINAELKGLDMPDTRVEISVEAGEPVPSGADSVKFLLKPHPKAPVLPLAEAASGGELSRIMLALEVSLATPPVSPSASAKKSARAGSSRVASTDTGGAGSGGETERRTFIFDEVDAGIGGQAGIEVGKRLARLAKDFQVIVVTHLAQVAAFADLQIQVSKSKGESIIAPLEPEARREELARMISGNILTETALQHADELLELAGVGQSEM